MEGSCCVRVRMCSSLFPYNIFSVSVVCCSEQQEDSLLQQRAGPGAVHSLHGARYRVSVTPESPPALARALFPKDAAVHIRAIHMF